VSDEIPALYDVARRTCHEFGLPWTDPRTGITYPPPCPHEWIPIEQVYAEIDEADAVAHTVFWLLGCRRCRTVDAFPACNAALMTPRFLAALRDELARHNWTVPPGIVWGPARRP
jgi:hypothetical protein